MKRSELILKLVDLYNDIPADASPYHVVDMLIGKAERLGLYPCEIEHLSGIGDLMTPKGWEEE